MFPSNQLPDGIVRLSNNFLPTLLGAGISKNSGISDIQGFPEQQLT